MLSLSWTCGHIIGRVEMVEVLVEVEVEMVMRSSPSGGPGAGVVVIDTSFNVSRW